MIHTTFNFHISTYNLLGYLAGRLNRSRSSVIKAAMQLQSGEANAEEMPAQAASYQNRDSRENWKTFHIDLTPEEYEYFFDMRKLFKLSVSFLIALALRKYGWRLSGDDVDKNIFAQYKFVQEIHYGIKFFITCWGNPGEGPSLHSKPG